MVVDNLSHRPVHQETGQIGHRPAHKPLNHRPTHQTEKINLEDVKQITTFEKYFQNTSVWIECLSAVTAIIITTEMDVVSDDYSLHSPSVFVAEY